MSKHWIDLGSLAAVFLMAACAKDALSPGLGSPGATALLKQEPAPIVVSNVDELYDAVNDLDNEGRVIELEPTIYRLDRARGRLELQQDMSLRGQSGNPAAVVIDALLLDTPDFTLPSGQRVGAIRVGRGTNTIEGLTIRNATKGAAGIETGLKGSGPSIVIISRVISANNQRGVDVRNLGIANFERALVVELTDNQFLDNSGMGGQGVRFVNGAGSGAASIIATMRNNELRGNIAGSLAANLSTSGATITITSHGDTFLDNGNGVVFLTGNATLGTFANNNMISFTAHPGRIADNGTTIPPFSDAGGLLAVGGLSEEPGHASNNTLSIDLHGVKFQHNRTPDIAAYGAQVKTLAGPAGSGNSVTITLNGSSKAATEEQQASVPGPAGTNTVTIIR